MPRRQLTANEKSHVIDQRPYCFICERDIRDVELAELAFDHIRALDDGGGNEILNFAAVHNRPCHQGRGTKSLEQHKYELRALFYFCDPLKYD